ncbi:hypothetical protein SLE2022_234950 [Rubroshorea leprosula]
MALARALQHITHMQVCIGSLILLGSEEIGINLDPAWEEITRLWERANWAPSTWMPLSDQLRFSPPIGFPSLSKMTILYWNVRGEGNLAFVRNARDLINHFNPSIVVFSETRVGQ